MQDCLALWLPGAAFGQRGHQRPTEPEPEQQGPGDGGLGAAGEDDECQHQRGDGAGVGVLLDEDAVPVRTPLTERMIGITSEQLLAIPEVIAIAYGTSKTEALRLAVRSGMVGGLVTHTAVARELIDRA